MSYKIVIVSTRNFDSGQLFGIENCEEEDLLYSDLCDGKGKNLIVYYNNSGAPSLKRQKLSEESKMDFINANRELFANWWQDNGVYVQDYLKRLGSEVEREVIREIMQKLVQRVELDNSHETEFLLLIRQKGCRDGFCESYPKEYFNYLYGDRTAKYFQLKDTAEPFQIFAVPCYDVPRGKELGKKYIRVLCDYFSKDTDDEIYLILHAKDICEENQDQNEALTGERLEEIKKINSKIKEVLLYRHTSNSKVHLFLSKNRNESQNIGREIENLICYYTYLKEAAELTGKIGSCLVSLDLEGLEECLEGNYNFDRVTTLELLGKMKTAVKKRELSSVREYYNELFKEFRSYGDAKN